MANSQKSSILRAFNTHFFEFLDDVLSIFPDNQDIAGAKVSIEIIRKANPTAIAKAWCSFVYLPYKDIILSGDIRFFFEKDYQTDLVYMDNAGDILKIIDKLREPIRNMSPESQGKTMQYIQNLSKLSMAYNNL